MKKRKFKKKYRSKKRKPILENNIISGVLVFLCFLIFTAYFAVFHPKIQLNEVVIINDQYINKKVLTDFVTSKTYKKILFFNAHSMLIVDKKELKKELLEKMPIIKDVKITKKFPNIIELEIKERVPASIWCDKKIKNTCYYIDKEGVAFQRADFMGKNFFIAIKEIKDFIIGDTVLFKDEIQTILIIEESIKRSNLDIKYFHIHSKEKIEIILEEGWSLKVSHVNIDEELNNFHFIYETNRELIDGAEDYIDLRFKGRLIVK